MCAKHYPVIRVNIKICRSVDLLFLKMRASRVKSLQVQRTHVTQMFFSNRKEVNTANVRIVHRYIYSMKASFNGRAENI